MARDKDSRRRPIVLASASPRRAALLREMGLKFSVSAPQIAEITPKHLTPSEIARVNAYRKALPSAREHPKALVIGADTVVALGRNVYGKPKDMGDARRMLSQLQGRTHSVITGVCLVELATRTLRLFSVTTRVKFRRLSTAQVQSYLRRIQPLDKAGAYAIQEFGDQIVESIQGSYTNVVGLPVEQLRRELRALSYPLPQRAKKVFRAGAEKS